MKKFWMTLGFVAMMGAACVSVSAKEWQYNDTLTIDMSSVKIKVNADGHETCTFNGVETIEGGTNEYTYVYDLTDRTIQIQNKEHKTKVLHYVTSFSPLPIDSTNEVVRERAEMAQRVYDMKMEEKKKK